MEQLTTIWILIHGTKTMAALGQVHTNFSRTTVVTMTMTTSGQTKCVALAVEGRLSPLVEITRTFR